MSVRAKHDAQPFWRRRLLTLVLAQLRQGISVHKLALTVAVGFTLGLFPILGTTSALCLTAGAWLKLNQPTLQLVNWIAAPLQLPGIYLFVRLGEWLTRSPAISFSIPQLLQHFRVSPLQFMRDWGSTGLRGIFAWSLMAPALLAVLYYASLPPLRAAARLREARHG